MSFLGIFTFSEIHFDDKCIAFSLFIAAHFLSMVFLCDRLDSFWLTFYNNNGSYFISNPSA